jgi:hypothetical protein
MEGPLVLEQGGRQRWVLYPPVDPHGDGYLAHLRVEVDDDGLHAETTATIDGYAAGGTADFPVFVRGHANDWRGWRRSRVWHALEHEMTVEAVHAGRGHVVLGVTLRRRRQAYAADAWLFRTVLVLEAGEEMTALARDVEHLFSVRPRNSG